MTADQGTLEWEDRYTRATALAVRGYLDAGIDLVVERAFWHRRARAMAAEVFAPYSAWLIGLQWELEVLEEREADRLDSIFPGTARRSAANHDLDLPYDFVIDTMAQSTADAARDLADWLASDPEPRGIRALA